MKTAIAALIASVALGTTAYAQNLDYELYGGVATQDSAGLGYGGGIFPVDSGTAFGAGVYTSLAGFEVGADLMVTKRGYSGFATHIESTSLMINARYPFQIAQDIEGYAGLGIGAVEVTYDGGTSFPFSTGNYTTPGGQLSLGARYNFGAFEGFGEVKYQTVFEAQPIGFPEVDYNSTSVLLGVRF